MPIYEYTCQTCKHVTEVLRPMRQADEALACESCGETTYRRQSEFAAGASKSSSTLLPPGGGCGHCGDPNGPCGMR